MKKEMMDKQTAKDNIEYITKVKIPEIKEAMDYWKKELKYNKKILMEK